MISNALKFTSKGFIKISLIMIEQETVNQNLENEENKENAK